MKSLLYKNILTLILFAILLNHNFALANKLSAEDILKKCDEAEGYKSQFGEMQQIITTSNGQKRTLVLRAWAINSGDKQLAEYLSPADVKGQKLLMTDEGDNIWMFNPETRRTRKLGSHMRKKKVMGSDFTYEDQSGGKMNRKYTGKILKTEKINKVDCYVMELKPTEDGPSYDKIVTWIGKEDFVARRVDYYIDGGKKPFKQLISENIKKSGSKIIPFKMTMTNLEDNTNTINLINKVKYDVNIPEKIFKPKNLER